MIFFDSYKTISSCYWVKLKSTVPPQLLLSVVPATIVVKKYTLKKQPSLLFVIIFLQKERFYRKVTEFRPDFISSVIKLLKCWRKRRNFYSFVDRAVKYQTTKVGRNLITSTKLKHIWEYL